MSSGLFIDMTNVIKTISPLKSWEFLKFWDWYYENLCKDLERFDHSKDPVYFPPEKDRFKALELTPFDKVKCVLLGQDPYHTKGLAHGLSFSVPPHIKKLPPSLRNVLKEYQADLGYPKPRSGDLNAWAERGVLLLNTVLTVEEGKANSHKGLGWEKLTYEVIRSLGDRGRVVFLLMGKQAQEYTGACQDCPVVAVAHPSPLSKGFPGSRPFSKVNAALKKLGVEEIDWKLT